MGLWHVCEVSFFNEVVYSGLGGGLRLPGAVLCAADKLSAAACTTQREAARVCVHERVTLRLAVHLFMAHRRWKGY